MCVVCRKWGGEYSVLGCWGLGEDDLSCGDLEKEMEFMVWEFC